MQLDALWTMEYATNQGDFGTGVVILVSGHIFGGDSNYAYEGNYVVNGDAVDAEVRLSQHHTNSAREPSRKERLLSLTGRRKGKLIELSGGSCDDDELRLCVQLSYRSPLADRADESHPADSETASSSSAGYMIGESSDRLPLF